MALLFGTNRRYAVQRTLIAAVIGPAGAGFQARDISLPHRLRAIASRFEAATQSFRLSALVDGDRRRQRYEPGQYGIFRSTGISLECFLTFITKLLDAPAGQVFVDRTKSGQVAFSSLFPSRETAPLSAENGRVKLHIFVDWSSVEVFGDDGQVCITDQIFPMPSSDGLALFANGGNARLVSLQIWPLRSIWDRR